MPKFTKAEAIEFQKFLQEISGYTKDFYEGMILQTLYFSNKPLADWQFVDEKLEFYILTVRECLRSLQKRNILYYNTSNETYSLNQDKTQWVKTN